MDWDERFIRVVSAVQKHRASRPWSRRDAQETAGGGFRGSIQAPQPRGCRDERGEGLVSQLLSDHVSTNRRVERRLSDFYLSATFA